jgi:hypothetical protein
MFTRRTVLAALVAAPVVSTERALGAAPFPKLTVTKDPTCGCCKGWTEHVQAAGFPVDVVETQELNRVKTRLGVPANLAACHTAEIDGYVIEGHVPAPAIARLLAERPPVKGPAVPGMPVGSPGMEVEGSPLDTFEVIAFGLGGQSPFARFRGAEAL